MEGGDSSSLDFHDWEVLTNSDSEAVVYPDDPTNFEEINADSGGMIRLDHFSMLSNNMFDDGSKAVVAATGAGDVESPVESDHPSWIDPALHKNPAELWSDSGSDRSDGRKVSDFVLRNELSVEEMARTGLGSGGVEETGGKDVNVESQLSFEEFEQNKSKVAEMSKFWSDCGGEDLVVGDAGDGGSSLEDSSEAADGGNDSVEETSIVEAGGGEENKKKQVVWWKVPFELLRCCVFRVGPVWTFSMAAAVMGLVILSRKLYKMKRKARSIELKVTVDDKKVSQFMSRAARLNEAFSVVRRVPIVRPMVPGGGGVTTWPVMSMR